MITDNKYYGTRITEQQQCVRESKYKMDGEMSQNSIIFAVASLCSLTHVVVKAAPDAAAGERLERAVVVHHLAARVLRVVLGVAQGGELLVGHFDRIREHGPHDHLIASRSGERAKVAVKAIEARRWGQEIVWFGVLCVHLVHFSCKHSLGSYSIYAGFSIKVKLFST